MRGEDVSVAFWKKVRVTPLVAGCWEWIGARTVDGYGRLEARGRQWQAHRLAYEMAVAPIPPGLVIDHLCRNPPCVRPDHLEPVTGAENTRRSRAALVGRSKTHCPKGHEYTPENTVLTASGLGGPKTHRSCRACKQACDRRRAGEVFRVRAVEVSEWRCLPSDHRARVLALLQASGEDTAARLLRALANIAGRGKRDIP